MQIQTQRISNLTHSPVAERQRPSWDDYFTKIAFTVAERSTCDRAHVGAVVVRDRRILTTGYNGAPAGLPHCDEIGHLIIDGHCVRTLHAEQNAIIQAALHGVSIAGSTIYVTHQPCLNCAKMIINAGIRRVVYAGNYPDQHSLHFFHEAGLSLEHLPHNLDKETLYTPPQEDAIMTERDVESNA
jgi:dCMP deaminase